MGRVRTEYMTASLSPQPWQPVGSWGYVVVSNGPAEPRKDHFDGVIVATPLEMAGIKLPAEAQQRAGHGREWLVASLCGFCQVSNISDCSRDLATCLPVRKLNYSCQPFDPIPASQGIRVPTWPLCTASWMRATSAMTPWRLENFRHLCSPLKIPLRPSYRLVSSTQSSTPETGINNQHAMQKGMIVWYTWNSITPEIFRSRSHCEFGGMAIFPAQIHKVFADDSVVVLSSDSSTGFARLMLFYSGCFTRGSLVN